MVNEDAALLNRRVTHMTPTALFSRRLHQDLNPGRASENEAENQPADRRCLQRRFGDARRFVRVSAVRWGLFPAKPGAQPCQPAVPSAPQPVDRFQRKGQTQFFRRRLDGKPGQHLDQPRPNQRSPQRVTRQNVR